MITHQEKQDLEAAAKVLADVIGKVYNNHVSELTNKTKKDHYHLILDKAIDACYEVMDLESLDPIPVEPPKPSRPSLEEVAKANKARVAEMFAARNKANQETLKAYRIK